MDEGVKQSIREYIIEIIKNTASIRSIERSMQVHGILSKPTGSGGIKGHSARACANALG